ncbi:Bestrophin-2 [Armadillidium vulgare]|nr:Bestrophin-2 [Armadillidium vulgare]
MICKFGKQFQEITIQKQTFTYWHIFIFHINIWFIRDARRLFEKICLHTQYFTELIPISFVLGFYVSIVVQRWWAQYENLPWPDALSLYTSTSIPGNDDRGRMMRRTIVRYANLAFTLTLIMISPKIKKRFPTLDHLVEAGLLTTNEKKIFEDMTSKTAHPMYWMPLVWAGTVVARARKEGKIRDDFAVKTIIDEINRLRGLCGMLLSYDWISIPLVWCYIIKLDTIKFHICRFAILIYSLFLALT